MDGTVLDAACAMDDHGNLHVLVVTDCIDGIGRLWHAVRKPQAGVSIREGGTWTAFKPEGDQGLASRRRFRILESIGVIQ